MLDVLFKDLAESYPREPRKGDPAFKGAPVGTLATKTLPTQIQNLLAVEGFRLLKDGSIGEGTWTHTPWVAAMDPAITETVAEGYYIVYLLSKGCSKLYLTINQGCSKVKSDLGIPQAKQILKKRALVMRQKIDGIAKRLKPIEIDLNVTPKVWRGKLYEAGVVCGIEYNLKSLPSSKDMTKDLLEAGRLYQFLKVEGGWDNIESLVAELDQDGVKCGKGRKAKLKQAKRYRIHRAIERNSSHSRLVKKIQGTICKGCDGDLTKVYGSIADGLIEAHHLRPLSTLENNAHVELDPMTDFVVLCPNCHRVIHRQDNVGDIEGLRASVATTRSTMS